MIISLLSSHSYFVSYNLIHIFLVFISIACVCMCFLNFSFPEEIKSIKHTKLRNSVFDDMRYMNFKF